MKINAPFELSVTPNELLALATKTDILNEYGLRLITSTLLALPLATKSRVIPGSMATPLGQFRRPPATSVMMPVVGLQYCKCEKG